MKAGLYVHALADERASTIRLAGRVVEFEDLGGIYAAVERRTAPPSLSADELRAQHEIVSAIVRTSAAVIPARFGSFTNRAELRRIVGERLDAIRAALDLVRGRSQMTTRIAGPAVEDDPASDRPGMSGRPGTAYLHGRRAAARPALPPGLLDRLDRAVAPLSVASRIDRGDAPVLARVYHLVERGSERRFRRALGSAARDLQPYTLTTTGPWPAFAFAPELWP
jgi:hypothetical protein